MSKAFLEKSSFLGLRPQLWVALNELDELEGGLLWYAENTSLLDGIRVE
jgi:hypothetical protein